MFSRALTFVFNQSILSCFSGTYGATTHLSAANECTNCPSGKYCEREGLDTWTGDCQAGYFCISGAKLKAPNDGGTGYICPQGKPFHLKA